MPNEDGDTGPRRRDTADPDRRPKESQEPDGVEEDGVQETVTRSPLDSTMTREGTVEPSPEQPSIEPTATHDQTRETPPPQVDATVTHDSDPHSAPQESQPSDLSVVDRDRYRVREFLGAGGMGEVFCAGDAVLDREVAIKYVRDDVQGVEHRREAFIREARISGNLDHPNIPPIFDLGVDENGRTFYVMRLIQGRSLKQILLDRKRDPSWTIARLLALFQQACLAIEFAHSRGVLHLDIKPANIMIGEYGELYVVDWGLSSRMDEKRKGGIRGTPAYMSPEQAAGAEELTPASDLFSLGTVLYEIVTGTRAFRDPNSTQVLAQVREASFEQGADWAAIPSALRETLLHALQKAPKDRPSNARALHDDVQAFLEGTKEKARKRKEADRSLEAARDELASRRDLLERAREASDDVERLRPESWTTASEKQPFWEAEDRADQLNTDAELAMERATRHMFQAFEHAPDDLEIRERLGELYWDRFTEAEQRADLFQQRFFESQLRRLDLPDYEDRLRGLGSLKIVVEPRAERAVLHRLVDRGRILCPEDEQIIQAGAAVVVDQLAMGRYQVTLERSGYRSIVAPVFIERGCAFEVDWRFRTDDEIGPDFVQVPPGSFVMGGDPDTFMSVARCRPEVGEFFIGRFPISWSEYLEFLQELLSRSNVSAKRRLPDISSEGTPSWFVEDDAVQYWRSDDVKKARGHWPIFGVSFHDATAYCAWRSERDGVTYTLPTDMEWEKAARGVDGRVFPWGDRYDASFCKNSGSTDRKAQPEAIGAYERDQSPYGVRDMAGTVREWCNSWFKKKDQQRLVRGGAWNFDQIGAHAAYRVGCPPALSYPFIGFRLVHHPTD